jgi:copper oxidase (laccase) domain-containing protein
MFKEGAAPCYSFTSIVIPNFEYGFIGRGIFDSAVSIEESRRQLQISYPEYHLALPKQVHGDTVIDLRTQAHQCKIGAPVYEGDAIIFSRDESKPMYYGIRTADCLPVMIIGARSLAIVHAGWRGLAARILSRACQLFGDDQPTYALIGPAAGRDRYQVGHEVIDAIGDNGAYRYQETDNSYYLDLAGTAHRELLVASPGIRIEDAAVCTISDQRFHSHRRDGANSGRNLLYVRSLL